MKKTLFLFLAIFAFLPSLAQESQIDTRFPPNSGNTVKEGKANTGFKDIYDQSIPEYDSLITYRLGRWVKYNAKIWQANDTVAVSQFPGTSTRWDCLTCPIDDPGGGGVDLSDYARKDEFSTLMKLNVEDYDIDWFLRPDAASPSGYFLQGRIDSMRWVPTSGSNRLNGVFGFSNASRIDASAVSGGILNIGTVNAATVNIGKAGSTIYPGNYALMVFLNSFNGANMEVGSTGGPFGNMGFNISQGASTQAVNANTFQSQNSTGTGSTVWLSNDQTNWLQMSINNTGGATKRTVFLSPTALRFGNNSFSTTIGAVNPTANRTVNFQNASGTVAYLSDLPGGGSGANPGHVLKNNATTLTQRATLQVLSDATVMRDSSATTSSILDLRNYIPFGGSSRLWTGTYRTGDQLSLQTDPTATYHSDFTQGSDGFTLEADGINISSDPIAGSMNVSGGGIALLANDPTHETQLVTHPDYIEVVGLDSLTTKGIRYGYQFFHASDASGTGWDKYLPTVKFVKDWVAAHGGGGSGSAIPLSGTTSGAPVTGDVRFNGGISTLKNMYSGSLAGQYSSFSLHDLTTAMLSWTSGLEFSEVEVSSSSGGFHNVTLQSSIPDGGGGSLGVGLTLDGDSQTVSVTGTTGFKGIQEAADYSANYTSLSLTNKGYVDGLIKKNTYTATAGQTVFTLSNTITTPLIVVVAGVVKDASQYTATGTTLTLTSGASAGQVVQIIYL